MTDNYQGLSVPQLIVLKLHQGVRYPLSCQATGFARSWDHVNPSCKAIQAMHLWLDLSGSDQSASFEELLAASGMV